MYTNTAIYNPLCYLPQIIGAAIGRIFGMSITGMAYLMRIFNFAAFVVLMYFAIKITPKFKLAILFIGLLPITLQEAVSLSPDALTNGLSIFMVAYVLYLAYEKKTKMKKAEIILLYVMAVMIGFLKIVYTPFVLLYLTIPTERFGSKKARWLNLGGIALSMIIANGIWLWISMKVPFAMMQPNLNINTKEQLMGIIKAPINYVRIATNSIDLWVYSWLRNMMGAELGAFVFRLPDTLTFVTFAIMVIILTQRDGLEIKKVDRMVYSMVLLMIVGALLTTLYLQWTPVGAESIEGVQGRYFIPVLMLIPVMIASGKKKDSVKKKTRYIEPEKALITERGIIYYGLFINVVALVTIAIKNI